MYWITGFNFFNNNLQISHSIIISLPRHQMNFTFVLEVAIVHIFVPPLKLKQQSVLYVIQTKNNNNNLGTRLTYVCIKLLVHTCQSTTLSDFHKSKS